MSEVCGAVEPGGKGVRCDRHSGHGGHHANAGRSWPTRRERSGEVEPRDTSMDLARVEREDVAGEIRWKIMPTPERVAAGQIVKGVPVVMYAFHEHDTAEAVCTTLNAMAIADAMGSVAEAEEKERQVARDEADVGPDLGGSPMEIRGAG